MNYLVQIKGLWIAQNAHSLTVEEVGLYFYLLEISNTLRWMNPFKRNNSKVMSDLGIKDRRTLDRYRNKLKQAQIIDFQTKNGDANVIYKLNDLSIFCTGFGIGDGIGSCIGDGIGDGIDNINKTKSKQNQTSEANASGPGAFFAQVKKPLKKKKPPDEEKTPFWAALVELWFQFNKENLKITPSFKGSDPRDLKSIVENLKKRSEAKGLEWIEQQAKDTLVSFLSYSFKDDWLRTHFLLSNLLKQFDNLITPQNVNGTTKSKQPDRTELKNQLAAKLSVNQG